MNNQQYIAELVEKLKEHNRQYRLGSPNISDLEYDQMVDALRELDPNNAWFTQIEPAPVSGSRKRRIPIPMKSLNKVKSLADVKQWLNSLAIPPTASIVITPKFDGVSWLHNEATGMTYSRGGSENEGQDCSLHYKNGMFSDYTESHGYNSPKITFGELVFRCKMWDVNYVKKNSPYKSPRNTAAGFINRDVVPPVEMMTLDFFRYGVGDESLEEYDTYTQLYDALSKTFGQPNLKWTIPVEQLSEELLSKLFIEWRKIYYIDGLVIYLDDLILWKVIGRQQNTGNPLYAMAYKHPDFTESFETTVKGIDWNVSKAGALKPVVNIEAVDTGDCTMENPTGYNAGWCKANRIATGSRILVTRSGGVIPKILETICGKTFSEPKICPACGAPTQYDEKGVELYCTNPECKGRKLAKIAHFLNIVGVENIGDETIAKMFNAGHQSIKSILNITWDELMGIEGFGEVISNNILDQMRKIKEGIDLATLMHASDCFQGIGKIKAQKILDEMSPTTFDWFIRGKVERVCQSNHELATLSKTQQSFVLGIVPFHEFLIETDIPFKIATQAVDKDGKYIGITVCFSGVRDSALEEEIKSGGGTIASGVSKKTTHLVVKDINGTSSKISKAKDLGIQILSIEDFKNKF